MDPRIGGTNRGYWYEFNECLQTVDNVLPGIPNLAYPPVNSKFVEIVDPDMETRKKVQSALFTISK